MGWKRGKEGKRTDEGGEEVLPDGDCSRLLFIDINCIVKKFFSSTCKKEMVERCCNRGGVEELLVGC